MGLVFEAHTIFIMDCTSLDGNRVVSLNSSEALVRHLGISLPTKALL